MNTAGEGLRLRRRRETTDDIQRATLALLETRGWEATTVAAISEAAGISSRTFFRYFESKEQAALPTQLRLLRACQEFSVAQPTFEQVSRALEGMLRTAMLGDDGQSEVEMHRRVARLFQVDPHLYVLAGSQDIELISVLQQRFIVLLPAHDRTELRALAELTMMIWRTAWWHWGAELSLTPDASPGDSLDAAVRAVSHAHAAGTAKNTL